MGTESFLVNPIEGDIASAYRFGLYFSDSLVPLSNISKNTGPTTSFSDTIPSPFSFTEGGGPNSPSFYLTNQFTRDTEGSLDEYRYQNYREKSPARPDTSNPILKFNEEYLDEPSIDTVWFWEETEWNDSNIVEICYELGGDTSPVSIQMSSDSGETWTVPINTIRDTAGDLGMEVTPGRHCLDWTMSEDYNGPESHDFRLKLSYWYGSCDTCNIVDSTDLTVLDESFYSRYPRGLTHMEGSVIFSESDGGSSLYKLNSSLVVNFS